MDRYGEIAATAACLAVIAHWRGGYIATLHPRGDEKVNIFSITSRAGEHLLQQNTDICKEYFLQLRWY